MADRAIGELPAAATLSDSSLLAVEQQGRAMKLTGAQFKEFAKAGVNVYVESAKKAAEDAANSAADAKDSADKAAQSANDAADSALSAKQYSGKPPKIENNYWYVWDAETQQYINTGEVARGNLMYATFAIIPETGDLYMFTDAEYTGPSFRLVDGEMEVVLIYGD